MRDHLHSERQLRETDRRGGPGSECGGWPGAPGRGGALLIAMLMAGCAPALDWRELRWPEAKLVAQFPCRPARQERSVPLAGQAVKMSLQVCDAGGASFAMTLTDVGEPARVPAAIEALRAAAIRNLDAAGVAAQPWVVPGMTPQPQAGRWQLSGRLPDGQAMESMMAITSRGRHVVQISVTSARLGETQFQPFLDGVRFAP